MRYLVVGSGLSGSTFARCMHDAGHDVTVIEQRNHIGGNVYDETAGSNYRQLYGPHLFHTNSSRVVEFLSRFTSWNKHTHKVKVEVHGKLVDMPVNFKTIETLFPRELAEEIIYRLIQEFGYNTQVNLDQLRGVSDEKIQILIDTVVNEMIVPYSEKQWGTDVFTLDPEILKRIPVRLNYDDRYFTDSFQAQPSLGFTQMVMRMLMGINVETSTLYVKGMEDFYDRVYFTGCVDALFDHDSGALPYRSLDFQWSQTRKDNQEWATVNHPSHMYLTRTTNFGLLKQEESSKAWFCSERPRDYEYKKREDIPYYPVRDATSRQLYHTYAERVSPKFILGGRLGRFEYLNMDQAVAQALMLANKEIQK